MEALREEKTAPFLSVDEQSTARTQNFSAWVLSNSWSQENVCLRPKPPPSLCVRRIQKQNRGESELTREECVMEKNGQTWVEWAGGQRTDSPATPLPKALTASTTSNHYSSATQQNIKEVDKGRWKINKVTKLGFFPP